MSTHRLLLAAAIDGAAWSGLTPLSGEVGSAFPADMPTFPCLPAFLHGFGSTSGRDLTSLLAIPWAAAGGAGTLTAGIDAAGLFYLEASDTDFAIGAGADNAVFGFPAAGVGLVGGMAPFRRTAAQPWQRGIVELAAGLSITPSGGAAELMPAPRRVQSLPVWLRVRGSEGDADDAWAGYTLTDADDDDASWVLERDGRVTRCVPTAALAAWGFNLETLRIELGATRPESSDPGDGYRSATTVTRSGLTLTTQADLAPSVVDALAATMRRTERIHASSEMAISGQRATHLDTVERGWEITVKVRGGGFGIEQDQTALLRAFNARATGGLTIYPQWGDRSAANGAMETRRHRPAWRAGSAATETLLYTGCASHPSRFFGVRAGGRLLQRRVVDDPLASRTEAYMYGVEGMQEVVIRTTDDLEAHAEQVEER